MSPVTAEHASVTPPATCARCGTALTLNHFLELACPSKPCKAAAHLADLRAADPRQVLQTQKLLMLHIGELESQLTAVLTALMACTVELETQLEQRARCGAWGEECPLQDADKSDDSHRMARHHARLVLNTIPGART